MKRVLFIDRDGTILKEPEDEQIDSLEKMEFLPYSISSLKKVQDLGYSLVMVSNQDGLGTESFPESHFRIVQNKMLSILQSEGIFFEEIFIDHHFPADNSPNRKPGIGMLKDYLKNNSLQVSDSWVIGDRYTDVILSKNLNCGALWLLDSSVPVHAYQQIEKDNKNQKPEIPFHEMNSWKDIVQFLESLVPKNPEAFHKPPYPRKVKLERNTKETRISLEMDLDGSGKYEIDTGLRFYDHMLEQLSRHSGVDIQLKVEGDLDIDEHHTIEDSAIALGQGFREAMGDKRGMERYGFVLPMDESLVSCSLDFSGRSYFIYKGTLDREYVGDFPTEMLEHWMKSFSEHAGLNLNLEILEGKNTHHKVEASFKALARCIRQALKIEGMELPSTKGIL
jgi:imidazoleglycerol-phosphate dehydratase/histidinol-phosphatase